MKKYYYIFLFVTVYYSGQLKVMAQILDANDFGFENTSVTDWTQVAGFTEETSIKSSGEKSMKATMNYPVNTPKLQTYRNSDKSNGYFDLIEGEYTISVMVYLVGEVPSGLKISPTSEPVFPIFSLDDIEKEKWVKLENTFSVSASELKNDAWVVINFTGMPDVGSGTVYIDDVFLEKEEEVVVPIISKIETVGSNNLDLEEGTYEISLNIWLDNEVTITQFYTNIETPYQSILWDISDVARNKWVELRQEIIINEAVMNSKFNIQVSTNSNLGGGTGTFYLDDIKIKDKILSLEPLLNNSFVLYPNPATTSVSIKSELESNVTIFDAFGKNVKSINIPASSSKINISKLISGVYFVKVCNNTGCTTKKMIIN